MAKTYFAELEREWRHNKKPGANRGVFEPLPPRFQRSKSLRGPDFVRELMRLSAMTGDARFEDALIALNEHHIVDQNYNFLPWEMPLMAQGREEIEGLTYATVYLKVRRGTSLRRACAEFAARAGWRATSFAAATKDVELIYRRHLAKDSQHKLVLHFLKKLMPRAKVAAFEARKNSSNESRAELEKSCSTSIPTTANN